MDWQKQNNEVYNQSAERLATYFASIGARIEDIERGLELAGKTTGARVVEIGCGDGRDAAEIIKRVGWYEGIDPSEGLLEIARQKVGNGSFVLANALSYEYPKDLDIVFAFASLLHVNRDDIQEVFQKVSRSLHPDGILYLSLKERSDYTEEIKEDEYGKRMFYYYTPELIEQLAGSAFQATYLGRQTIGHTDWFTLALMRT